MDTLRDTFIEYYLGETDYNKWSQQQRDHVQELFFRENPEEFENITVGHFIPELLQLLSGSERTNDIDQVLLVTLREKIARIGWDEFELSLAFDRLLEEAESCYQEYLRHEEYNPEEHDDQNGGFGNLMRRAMENPTWI